MSVEAFSDVVTWCVRYGVDEITFLGGEPSLHPSFPEMVSLAHSRGLDVRVVTNGARRFRRLMESGLIGRRNLSRVAVSLDTLDETVQDAFRGRGAWQDAMDTIRLLRDRGVLFDINVTGVRPVLDGIGALIHFADDAGCRRVNVHWPSSIGLGADLTADHIPDREEWQNLVLMARNGWRRGLTSSSKSSVGSWPRVTHSSDAPWTTSPTCRYSRTAGPIAAACWLTKTGMASLTMTGDQLRLTRPGFGEELLRSSTSSGCDTCPAMQADERRACIYDKVSSVPSG